MAFSDELCLSEFTGLGLGDPAGASTGQSRTRRSFRGDKQSTRFAARLVAAKFGYHTEKFVGSDSECIVLEARSFSFSEHQG